jgi:hypothetical protein
VCTLVRLPALHCEHLQKKKTLINISEKKSSKIEETNSIETKVNEM